MSDLSRLADTLATEVTALRRSVDRAERASFRNSIVVTVLVLAVLLIGVNAYQQYQTNQRSQETAGRVEAITQKSLCPLFALFVGSYDPTSRPEGPARDKYEDAFEVMREANVELRCTGDPVPPRQGG